MKTTIDISGPLLEQAKRVAARESITLKELVETGLRRVLKEHSHSEAFKLRDARVCGRGLQPGFRGADWDRIREAAYEDHGA